MRILLIIILFIVILLFVIFFLSIIIIKSSSSSSSLNCEVESHLLFQIKWDTVASSAVGHCFAFLEIIQHNYHNPRKSLWRWWSFSFIRMNKLRVNIARGTTDPEIDSVTWTNLATRWRNLHQLKIWPQDGATYISCKFGHQMVPLALFANSATRWHQLH